MKPFLLLLLVVRPVVADEPPLVDPDTEVSRREFERGSHLYGDGDYQGAIAAFKVGNQALPRPEFDYNIARCYDRLGDWAKALDYYQRYLAQPGADDRNGEVKARVVALKLREPPLRPSRKLRIAAWVIGAAALGSLVAAGGLYGSAAVNFSSRRSYCGSLPRECVPSEWSDLEARANAGYSLFAIAGVLFVADVALWVVDAKRARAHAWLGPFVAGAGF